MKTFYLTLDVNLQVEVPIQAENLQQAMKKASEENYELPSLNDGQISDTYMRYMRDENYNVVHEYEDN